MNLNQTLKQELKLTMYTRKMVINKQFQYTRPNVETRFVNFAKIINDKMAD